MSGIKTNLKDLGKCFQAFSASIERERAMIAEYKWTFIKQGVSPWMAENLAKEKYRQIHKK